MLKTALEYEASLIPAMRATWNTPWSKYYFNNSFYQDVEVDRNDWNRIQMVSVDEKQKLHGYLSVNLKQNMGAADQMCVISFNGKSDYVFSADCLDFIRYLFVDRGIERLEWDVVIGNPAEKMYDKLCKKLGGNIIGICHKAAMLTNRQVVDLKLYEAFKEDSIKYFLNHRNYQGRITNG